MERNGESRSDNSTHVIGGFDKAGKAFVLVVGGALGAGVGALVPVAAGWAADLPWMPFQGPLQLLGSFDQTWLTVGRPVIGALLGLAFAAWVIANTPVLHVEPDAVRVAKRGKVERVLAREKIDAVFRRGSATVIQAKSGRELFAGDVEGDKENIRSIFVDAGYPWEGSDR